VSRGFNGAGIRAQRRLFRDCGDMLSRPPQERAEGGLSSADRRVGDRRVGRSSRRFGMADLLRRESRNAALIANPTRIDELTSDIWHYILTMGLKGDTLLQCTIKGGGNGNR